MSNKNYGTKLDINKGEWRNRILIATPATGSVRMEWVLARYGQIIPTNWSQVNLIQWTNNFVPLKYLLPDAENLIAKEVIRGDFEWLLMVEEDNILPENLFVQLNQYMMEKKVPIVSSVYFTKSVPPEPIMYRGRGNGSYQDWQFGDKVWVDGIPFGCTLIHASIIRAMWAESPEYTIGNQVTRRVFSQPNEIIGDNSTGHEMFTGTTDLEWCTRIMKEGFFEKAGWSEFQKKKYPFLVDTNMFVKHIDLQGRQFPLEIPETYVKKTT